MQRQEAHEIPGRGHVGPLQRQVVLTALQRVPGEVARFDHNRDGRLDLSEFIDFSAHVKVRAAPALSAVSSVTHHHRRIPGAQAGKAAEAKAAAAPAPATSA